MKYRTPEISNSLANRHRKQFSKALTAVNDVGVANNSIKFDLKGNEEKQRDLAKH